MKKTLASLLALCMMLGVFTGCSTNKQNETVNNESAVNGATVEAAATVVEGNDAVSAPKYVFLFIGDGMSFNHILGTEQYNTVKAGANETLRLNFTQFDTRNFVTNYSTSNLVTDSAAAGTALASGVKTANSYIGVDAEGNEFEDNDERAIFFARGVLETVKKLNWSPNIVHCMGWMSAIVPIYLKKVFNDDPLFRDVKVVVSLCDDSFNTPFNADFAQKIANEGVKDEKLSELSTPSYENLYRFVIDYADAVVVASADANPSLVEYARCSGKPMLEYKECEQVEMFDNYNRFYEELQ